MIGSGNGLFYVQSQAFAWTSAVLLSLWVFWNKFELILNPYMFK